MRALTGAATPDPPCVACGLRPGVTVADITDAVSAWLCQPCSVPWVTTDTTVQVMFDDERGE